jgi:1-hydroxycarotenoid 3,4-desaturase
MLKTRSDRVIVIGAGVAGLVAALELSARGAQVTVLEKEATPGGKLREITVGNARIDAGPTVFTLRRVFDAVFASAGMRLDDHLTLKPADIIARHAWSEGGRLDLFADPEQTAEAIGDFAGAAAAKGYRSFCRQAKSIYDTLENTFMMASKPSLPVLMKRVAAENVLGLWRINPYQTMWRALGGHFRDPRLQQLFGRYSTYCGSSPFHAPATLMLIAHVEREGVWLVDGGMFRIAEALAEAGARLGADYRYGEDVREIIVEHGRAAGVRLASGETIRADAVVLNADTAALAQGLFGAEAKRGVAAMPRSARSLSALTWVMVAQTSGFPLVRHTVFFGRDYADEFRDIFNRSRLPEKPTVYVCAQDRDDAGAASLPGPERLLFIVNAPATGDTQRFNTSETDPCEERTFRLLQSCGLTVERRPETTVMTTPTDFNRLFPGTGGAIYGRASHGWMASFRRPGSRSRVPGLYLAGGSTHPGAGVPMAALSGRMAASALMSDLASTRV